MLNQQNLQIICGFHALKSQYVFRRKHGVSQGEHNDNQLYDKLDQISLVRKCFITIVCFPQKKWYTTRQAGLTSGCATLAWGRFCAPREILILGMAYEIHLHLVEVVLFKANHKLNELCWHILLGNQPSS